MESVVDNSSRSKEVSVRTAQLVQLLTELGPDIPEIARNLGQFKESVRYRYKEKILNKGFAVQASVDHERLGLKRVVAVVGFEADYEPYAQSILTAMSELCYVLSHSKTFPDGKYIVNFSVPKEFASSIPRLLDSLKSQGILKTAEVLEFEWARVPAMKAEFYDFDEGRWDFDFASRAENFEAASFRPSSPARFDQVDLLIIRELQKDANKSLKEISDELKLNYKKLAWHYNTHVVGRNLLRGYMVRWMGTRYDFKVDRALHRKHRYMPMVILVKNVDELNLASVREKMNRLPFLWTEASGKNYYAEFAFPVDYLTESLLYVTEAVSKVRDRVMMFSIDQTNAIGFSIAPRLFDERERRWTFSYETLIQRFDNLAQQVREQARKS